MSGHRRKKTFNLEDNEDEFPTIGLGASAPAPTQPPKGVWGKPAWGSAKPEPKPEPVAPEQSSSEPSTSGGGGGGGPWKVLTRKVSTEAKEIATNIESMKLTESSSVTQQPLAEPPKPAPTTTAAAPPRWNVTPRLSTIEGKMDASMTLSPSPSVTSDKLDSATGSATPGGAKAVVAEEAPPPPPKSVWNRPPPPVPTPSTTASTDTAGTLTQETSYSGRDSSGGRGRQQSAGRGGGGGGRGRKPMSDRKDRPNPDFICNQLDSCDVVKSRPTTDEGFGQTKKGKQGKPIDLTTNYYPLESMTNFNLFQYHVEFKPDEERTEVRKKLVKIHETTLGAFIFDGQALYTPHRIIKNPLLLYSMNSYTNQKIQISIRLVSEITPVDTVFLQVYNIIFRNIMTSMDLEPMGRFYYDPAHKTAIPSRKLEIWPGYITSVRNHEDRILLNLELTHKVVRSDTVLDYIQHTRESVEGTQPVSRGGGAAPQPRGRMDYKYEVMKGLLGSVILTRYNKKNYKVDDIRWDVTPDNEFRMRDGKMMSYKQYYKNQYGTLIKNSKQPMLVSLPKKKDYHRGASQPIYLVPEICQMTGLNDSMRKDVNLMKDLANHLVMSPFQRVTRANAFIERWYADPKIKEELERWNITIGRKPIKCVGRVVDLDDLLVGSFHSTGVKSKMKQDKPGDWTNLFKSKPMLSTVPLKRWILISCPRSEQVTDQLLTSLKSTAKSMNFQVDNPIMKLMLRDTKPNTYSSTIQQLFDQARKNVQMIVTLLPNNSPEVYTAIKRKCYCDIGVSSQCILVKTMLTKNPASVASRLAIQMNAKLGGEPWAVEIPLKDLMIIGYDVYHSSNKRAPSVGALVASTSNSMAKYFAATYFHKNRSELSANLCSAMTNALHTYKQVNKGKPPARIILYRDGVGDGQLSYIYNTELSQIKEAIRLVYSNDIYPPPKFSFIVVTKRIHTRIYGPPEPHVGGPQEVNPPPGTIVDDVITRPERYDFYLVSQAVNNICATVSPTSYNVLWDEQGLDPDKMQRLTLKLCHLYYNYTGTIAVPAPCQFAHKLAYLTGMSLSNPTNKALQNLLYFL